MASATKYFLTILTYYILFCIFGIMLFSIFDALRGAPALGGGPSGIIPFLATWVAATMMTGHKYPGRAAREEIKAKNREISIYFALTQFVISAVFVIFASPIPDILINAVIVIICTIIGYALCYYSIENSLKVAEKDMARFKESIGKEKDPEKKKKMEENLKRYD
ncbi:MAG: hypothetical protein NTY68_02770 [Candidatus Micrarchaeota archaeon]|nr:hypothetical protein [Candidatus Micrarchaeota archaeon]